MGQSPCAYLLVFNWMDWCWQGDKLHVPQRGGGGPAGAREGAPERTADEFAARERRYRCLSEPAGAGGPAGAGRALHGAGRP